MKKKKTIFLETIYNLVENVLIRSKLPVNV